MKYTFEIKERIDSFELLAYQGLEVREFTIQQRSQHGLIVESSDT